AKCGVIPAALIVSEDLDSRLEAGALLDLLGNKVGDAAETHVAELVDLARLHLHRALLRLGPLSDNDDRREATFLVALLEVVADALDVEILLGDEDLGRAAGDARLGGDPTRMATHDLDDHDAVVRLGCRVQAVDGVG